VHLCFGNYGGQTIQKGEWGKLIGYLNALHVDHIIMETAHRPPLLSSPTKQLLTSRLRRLQTLSCWCAH